VPDSELTLVPDTVIQTDPVRLAGPKICVDSRNRAHVVFEQGVYGTGGDKYVYHIREEGEQGVAAGTLPPARLPLVVFPNPVQGAAQVRFTLARPVAVRLRLYDAAGRLARTVLEGTLAAGDKSVALRSRGLKPGSYFLVLDAGTASERVKLIVTGR
jgi:hypothetical protein